MFIPLCDDVEKRHPPIVTGLLISLNLLVFIYQFRLSLDDPTFETYIAFIYEWGLIPKDLANGEVMGLFTSMFIHGDFMHFLGNMVVLWAFSYTLENVLGPLKLGLLYVISGLAGGVAHCLADWGGEIPMVGASGAIAGLIGAYCLIFGVATRMKTLIWIFIRPWVVQIPTCVYVVIWLLMQLLGVVLESAEGQEGGVAWWAHLGGFAIGMGFLPLVNDGKRKLKQEKDGRLVVADELQPSAEDSGADPHAPQEPERCQHCQTELDDSTLIGPTLYRCPNAACGQMHLARTALPKPVART